MLRSSYIYFLFAVTPLFFSCSTEDYFVDDVKDKAVEAEMYGYWGLYESHMETNPDSSLYYLENLKEFAAAKGEDKWVGNAHWATGYVQDKIGYMGDAVYNLLIAAKIYKKIGELNKLANVNHSIGEIYWAAGDRNTAISYYQQAIDIFEYEGSSEDRGSVLRNIAINYRELGEYAKAEDYLKKALQIVLDAKDYKLISLTYNSLGMVCVERKEYDKAIGYYDLVVQYTDSLPGGGLLKNKGMAFNNIGEVYLKQGQLDLAEEWLHNALVVKKEVGDPVLTQSTYNLLGEMHIERGDFSKALTVLEEGLHQLNLESSGTSSAVEEGFTLLSKALLAMNADASPAQYAFLNEKFAQYSGRLLTYNNRVGDIRKDLEASNRLQSVQAAADRYAYNEQLLLAEERTARMKYFLILPIALLIITLISAFISFRRNQHYKRLYSNIEHVLNKSKAVRNARNS